MFRFRGSFFADLCVAVWTEGLAVTIKMRFQIYPAYFGRGLRIYSNVENSERGKKMSANGLRRIRWRRVAVARGHRTSPRVISRET